MYFFPIKVLLLDTYVEVLFTQSSNTVFSLYFSVLYVRVWEKLMQKGAAPANRVTGRKLLPPI